MKREQVSTTLESSIIERLARVATVDRRSISQVAAMCIELGLPRVEEEVGMERGGRVLENPPSVERPERKERNRQRRIEPQILTALALLFPLALTLAAGEQVASIRAVALSLQLGPTSLSPSLDGPLRSYFTTFNNMPGVSRYDLAGGFYLFSGEFGPVTRGSTLYFSDWIAFVQTGVWAGTVNDTGYIVATVPSDDADGNWLPDFLERDRTIDRTIAAISHSDSYNLDGALTVRFVRTAGLQVGLYYARDVTGLYNVNGIWALGMATGTVTYNRGTRQARLNLTSASTVGEFRYTCTTTFTVPDNRHFNLPPLTIIRHDGRVMQTSAHTLLHHTGNRYTGLFTFIDGNVDTTWPDMQDYWVEIVDTNDADADGIPDLTDDPVPPQAVKLAIVRAGAKVQIRSGVNQNRVLSLQATTDFRQWYEVDRMPVTPAGGYFVELPANLRNQQFYRATVLP